MKPRAKPEPRRRLNLANPLSKSANRVRDTNKMNRAAQTLGRLGGKASSKVKSAAKARASRRNGAKGGRPRKKITNEAKP